MSDGTAFMEIGARLYALEQQQRRQEALIQQLLEALQGDTHAEDGKSDTAKQANR